LDKAIIMATEANYYEILGVERTASQAEIRKAYRRLAITEHPDKKGSTEAASNLFKEINNAYDNLKDPDLRAQYDKKLQNPPNPPSARTPRRDTSEEYEVKITPRKKGTALEEKIIASLNSPNKADYETYVKTTSTHKVETFFIMFLTEKEREPFIKNATKFNIQLPSTEVDNFFVKAVIMERYLSAGATPVDKNIIDALFTLKNTGIPSNSRADDYARKVAVSLGKNITLDIYQHINSEIHAGGYFTAGERANFFESLMKTPLTFGDAVTLAKSGQVLTPLNLNNNMVYYINENIGSKTGNAEILLWANLSQKIDYSNPTASSNVADITKKMSPDLYESSFLKLDSKIQTEIIKNLESIPNHNKNSNVKQFLQKHQMAEKSQAAIAKAEVVKEKAVSSHIAAEATVSNLKFGSFQGMDTNSKTALTTQLKSEVKRGDSRLFLQALDKVTGSKFSAVQHADLAKKASDYLAEPSGLFRNKSPNSIAAATLIDNFFKSKNGQPLTSEDKLVLWVMLNPYLADPQQNKNMVGNERTFSASVRGLYNDLADDVKKGGAFELHNVVKPDETRKILHAYGDQKSGKQVDVNAILHPEQKPKVAAGGQEATPAANRM